MRNPIHQKRKRLFRGLDLASSGCDMHICMTGDSIPPMFTPSQSANRSCSTQLRKSLIIISYVQSFLARIFLFYIPICLGLGLQGPFCFLLLHFFINPVCVKTLLLSSYFFRKPVLKYTYLPLFSIILTLSPFFTLKLFC